MGYKVKDEIEELEVYLKTLRGALDDLQKLSSYMKEKIDNIKKQDVCVNIYNAERELWVNVNDNKREEINEKLK